MRFHNRIDHGDYMHIFSEWKCSLAMNGENLCASPNAPLLTGSSICLSLTNPSVHVKLVQSTYDFRC